MDKQEIILIGEIFRLYIDNDSVEIFSNLKINTSDFIHIPEIEKQVNILKNENKNISDSPQIVESIVVERLSLPKTEVFQYLIGCFRKIMVEKDKSWNRNNDKLQEFFLEALQIIRNYLTLCITTPEFFENGIFNINSSYFIYPNQNQKITNFLKLTMNFQDVELTENLYETLLEENPNLFENIKRLFFLEIQNKLTIFNPKWDEILNYIIFLVNIKNFKKSIILELNAVNKAKTARQIENFLLFGLILTITIIPDNMDPRIEEFSKRATQKIEDCKTKNGYLKTCNVF